MGIGLAGGYGAGAASDFLEQLLLQRAKQEAFEEQRRQALADEAMRAQQLQQQGEQFGQRLGLDRETLGQRQAEFAEEAPERGARTKFIGAQTVDLEGKPMRETQAHERDKEMLGLRGTQEHGFIKARSSEELRQIAAQGSISKEVAGMRQSAGLTPGQTANFTRGLQKDWRAVSVNARELDRQVQNIQVGLDAARAGNLAQGAQTLLVTFQKILDPVSVVRESEYMRSAAGQSLVNQVVGRLERAVSGGAGVPLPELEKYADVALRIAKTAPMSLERERGRIAATAEQYGIDPTLVVDDAVVPSAAAAETSGSGEPAPKVGDLKTFPSGRTGRWDGKGWVLVP